MTEPTDPRADPRAAPRPPEPVDPAERPRASWASDAPLRFSSPEEDRSRRRNATVGVAVVFAVAIALGSYFLFFDDDAAPKPITLPASFPGHQELTSAGLQEAEDQLRDRLAGRARGAVRAALEVADVSTYARGSTGVAELVVLAFPTSALHTSSAPYEVTDQMFSYLHPNNREYPTGALGGSVRCGPISTHGIRLSACAWSDPAATGVVYAISPATKPDQLASTVNDLRGQIGHHGSPSTSGSGASSSSVARPGPSTHPAPRTRHPAPARRVVAPAAFGRYKRTRGAAGRQATQRVRSALTGSDPRAAAFRDAAVALYVRSPDAPQILFVGNDIGNDTVRSMIQEESPSHDTLNFLAGSGATAIKEYPAGPLGGSLRCAASGKVPYPSCAWVDRSSLGWVIEYGKSDPRTLAAVTRQLRRAAEH